MEETVYDAVEKTTAIGHYWSQVPPIPLGVDDHAGVIKSRDLFKMT